MCLPKRIAPLVSLVLLAFAFAEVRGDDREGPPRTPPKVNAEKADIQDLPPMEVDPRLLEPGKGPQVPTGPSRTGGGLLDHFEPADLGRPGSASTPRKGPALPRDSSGSAGPAGDVEIPSAGPDLGDARPVLPGAAPSGPCTDTGDPSVVFGKLPFPSGMPPVGTGPASALPDLRLPERWAVENAGQQGAAASYVRIACTAFQGGGPSGACGQGEVAIPAIPAGEVHNFFLPLLEQFGAAMPVCESGPESCVFSLTADVRHEIVEGNEANNSRSFTFCPK